MTCDNEKADWSHLLQKPQCEYSVISILLLGIKGTWNSVIKCFHMRSDNCKQPATALSALLNVLVCRLIKVFKAPAFATWVYQKRFLYRFIRDNLSSLVIVNVGVLRIEYLNMLASVTSDFWSGSLYTSFHLFSGLLSAKDFIPPFFLIFYIYFCSH